MSSSMHGSWPGLLDELERALILHFDLRSAHARARELLSDPVCEAAERETVDARAAYRAMQHEGGTLEQLERARRRQADAEAVVGMLEDWRARDRAEEHLAVDVFAGASSLGPARDPNWLPGVAPSPGSTRSRVDTPVFLRDAQVRFCGHFEPRVGLLIHDPGLGTLAMVQIVDASGSAEIQTQVRQYVDRATYLRHLLLTARDQDPGNDSQVVSVELVLVHCKAADDDPSRADLLHDVGEALRQLAQRTDFLHAIGINVLAADAHALPGAHGPAGGEVCEAFSPTQLRRAFSWLLHDARRWFRAIEGRRKDAGRSHRLREIQLDEYRLPGRRRLVLHDHARLHLLHGHNGSGKSSLVEALELMITGAIERLSGIDDYEHVVRNRWSPTPAGITLVTDAEPLRFELHGTDRPAQPLAPRSRAASFRLDQTVMDRLARASDVDRAAELLSAFFSDEAEVRERWQTAVAEAEAALARLPTRMRRWLESHRRERQELHDVVVEQLAGLAEQRVDARLVDAILPIPRASSRPLLGQLDALAQLDAALARDGYIPSDDPLWAALEQAFDHIAEDLPARLRTVESVIRTVDRLGRWWQEEQGGGFASEAAFAEALDEWLELSALVEVAEQQGRVLATLRNAIERGWDPRRLDEAQTAGPLLRSLASVEPMVIADLERARIDWGKRREQLGRALRRSSETPVDGKPTAPVRVHLDDDEIAELDRFGTWWAPDERGSGLGQRIRAAIERGETHSFANAEIGVHDWVRPIREAAVQMLGPLRELKAALGIERAEPRPAAPRSRVLAVGGLAPADEGATRGPRRIRGPVSAPATPRGVPRITSPKADGAPAPRPDPEPPTETPSSPLASDRAAPDSLGPVDLLARLRWVYDVSMQAHEVGAEVQDSFVWRLAANDERALGLIDALNELMALFTPARWAYEDVTLRYQVSGPISRLRFETGELRGGEDPHARARADLRLNTAQLNAFTLALFLLCAPRVENPLGLLVLDDPLQNMDELTVTTLARGLAKLLRVLPSRWSLMMLFHGEGDLARFHDEVECGVYFLPWLSPTVRGQQVDIRCHAEDSRLHLTPQAIDGLVTLWPK